MDQKMRIASFLIASAVASVSVAQVDTLKILVAKDYTVGGVTPVAAFSTFGYKPADLSDPQNPIGEKFYAVGFNGTGQDIREIVNADAVLPATPSYTRLVTNTPYVMFLKDGNLDRGGGAPTPASLVLNKTAFGSIGAYGAAFISDNGGVVTTGGVSNPELTQRIYRYNLQLDTNADARDEMTSLVTLQQMKDVTGATSNSTNLGRQLSLSSDSSKVYFTDVSASFGGLWRVSSLGGSLERLVVDADINTETSVSNVGGNDRIYFRGTAASSNLGGIDYYDTADNTRKSAVSGAAVADFMQTTTAGITTLSTTTDSEGNVYFNNNTSNPERRGIYKLDAQGRMIKVVSYAERNAFITAATGSAANANTLRMQSRTTTYAGTGGTFDLTQIMYADQGTPGTITGVYVFKAGDFNRDNTVTQADLDLFASKLTVRDVAIVVDDSRYDLNGNNVIDWKDVKVLQSFLEFSNGDTNFDFSVNFDDLLSLAQNYGLAAKRWVEGDFDGDDDVDFDDLLTLAQNYEGSGTLTDISGISSPSDSFAADWAMALSLVPEPTALAGLAWAGLGLRRTRRH